MNSLSDGPLADVLDRLLAAAEAQHGPGRPGPGAGRRPRPEHAAGDYRAEFAGAQERFMAVSPTTGRLLYTLVRTSGARTVVEFGTSFGVSTLFLAAGVRDNGGGRVIGTEFEPSKVAATRASASQAGVGDVVEVREGDALQTLGSDLPERIDLVLLDGAKGMYLDVFRLLDPRLAVGALVLADNAGRSGDYREAIRADRRYVSTGLDDLDLELSCKLEV